MLKLHVLDALVGMVDRTAVFVLLLQGRMGMLLLHGVHIKSVAVYIWLVLKMFSVCYAFLIYFHPKGLSMSTTLSATTKCSVQ